MSLHEVMKGKEPIEAVTFSLIETKKREAAALERKVQEFLAGGGKIQNLDINQAAIDTAEMALLVNEFGGYDLTRSKKIANQKKHTEDMHQDFYAGKNRRKERCIHGQNIKLRKNGYYCEIAKFTSPVYPPTEEGRAQAIAWRDQMRVKLNMTPAEY